MLKNLQQKEENNNDKIQSRLATTIDIDIQEKMTIPLNKVEDFLKDLTEFKIKWSG